MVFVNDFTAMPRLDYIGKGTASLLLAESYLGWDLSSAEMTSGG